LAHLDGGPDWEATVELIRIHTRQFAKRQLTWFRHLTQLIPVPSDAPNVLVQILTTFQSDFTGKSHAGEIDTHA